MDQNKKQDIALMRYSAISPLIAGTREDFPSLTAFFRDASAKGVKAPNGDLRHYSPATIEKWYFSYKHGGFDALLPASRSDRGVSRKIDADLEEQKARIAKLRKEAEEDGAAPPEINVSIVGDADKYAK